MKEVDSGVGQGSIYLQVRDHLCYGGGEASGGWGGVQTHCPKKLFNSIWKNLHEGGEIVTPKIKNNFVSVTTALQLCDIINTDCRSGNSMEDLMIGMSCCIISDAIIIQ